MRIKSLHLRDFKRFTDLTITLDADRPKKIVALVGPNGSGKSSVFDAFEELGSGLKGRPGKPGSYYKKSIFSGEAVGDNYDPTNHVMLVSDQDGLQKTSFYIRTAYRFTPRLAVNSMQKLPDADGDTSRPHYLIDTDTRLTENYSRLLGRFYDDVFDKDLTGKAWAQKNVDGLNAVLMAVLDIKVSLLGNPVAGKGSLYFEKGTSKEFPYENLSAGEKEVVDLVLDLYVKRDTYTNSVICIDEPELHLNTSIQRSLLVELEKLVPDGSQLWIATHSIGFLRALQEELWEKTVVVDFTGQDFDTPVALGPIAGTRDDWSRIFATALEDLTGLLAPRRIVYCEGRPDPNAAGGDQGLDAEVYNTIFGATHNDTLFVSSGGGGEVKKNALLALKVLGKAFDGVELLLLKDRDLLTDPEREVFLAADASHRMLTRHELENFLFDKAVVAAFSNLHGFQFDEAGYDAAVTDIGTQDLKLEQQAIQAACGYVGGVPDFKRSLATVIAPPMAVYVELEAAVFPQPV